MAAPRTLQMGLSERKAQMCSNAKLRKERPAKSKVLNTSNVVIIASGDRSPTAKTYLASWHHNMSFIVCQTFDRFVKLWLHLASEGSFNKQHVDSI